MHFHARVSRFLPKWAAEPQKVKNKGNRVRGKSGRKEMSLYVSGYERRCRDGQGRDGEAHFLPEMEH